jgi:hypothetical protein
MKKTFLIFTVLLFFYTKNSFSQINSSGFDSISKSFYSRVVPIGTSLDAGKFSSRIIQNFELGKTFGPIDIGVAFGRFSSSDSTNFAQLRTTLDATQIGVFSSEFSVGVGKVFNSSTPLMFEISTTLLAQFTQKIGVGAIFGSYDFIGEYERGNKQFFGLFLRYGPMRNEFGGLIGRATRSIGRRRVGRR